MIFFGYVLLFMTIFKFYLWFFIEGSVGLNNRMH